jgi:UDP-N-acetylglucosamine/UDP-N-acetylgalactosamine diphosphorylase
LQGDTAARERAVAAGKQALAAGEVAFVLVAGGQGSRLGFPLPKGMLPIGPISGRTLFEVILASVQARGRGGGSIPVCIMTSPATHDATVAYFAERDLLGFPPDQFEIFCQATMPAVDAHTGQLLLAEKHRLALSPDGHGGIVSAMQRNGVLERLQRRGIKHLFYGQVDNPLLQVCDPLTLGAHILAESEMTTQVVRKTDPFQRVGNVVQVDGRVQIIEYSDLPESAARALSSDGSLKLWAGSIAVHVIDLAFLERCTHGAEALPFHRAHKRVPYVDAAGRRIEPRENNAIKFERFVFDLLPHARNPLVLEIDPADGFAPVKNEPGAATETVHTAQAAMIRRFQRWLRASGATIADDVTVEICPLFALDLAELRTRVRAGTSISEPTYFRESAADVAEHADAEDS